ncbi:MAG: ATP-binding cassette domain-containing protein [Cyanobacteria bacterium P01_D01_bin.123]
MSGSAIISTSERKPLVELRGISKRFGELTVLDEVDLTVYQGEALGIVGPSGTGKSTILRIIAGLLPADSGTIAWYGGQPQTATRFDRVPERLSMVFQQSALFDSLTVDENVGFLLYQHSRLPRSRVRELVKEKLAAVGLHGIEDRLPSQLSGGMRKRVSFARAIMEDPDDPTDDPLILLYDEPTAGLDPIASTVLEDLIRDLQVGQNLCATYAIVTHQDSTIRRTSDRIVLLAGGKVRWEGGVPDIERTDNPYVRQFFSGDVQGPIRPPGQPQEA